MKPIEILEQYLLAGKPVSIKVFNMGENLGADFAYLCHFHVLRKLFNTLIIDMYRSNVDETNAIGFGNTDLFLDYFPTTRVFEELVKQHYVDGTDWVQKLNNKEFDILSEFFRDTGTYDFFTGYGMGDSEVWRSQYPLDRWVTIHELTSLAHKHTANKLPDLPILDADQFDIGTDFTRLSAQWSRMALEYKCFDDPQYPFVFQETVTERYKKYSDYLYVSLRKPDHVRWYYTVQRQFEIVINIIRKLKAAGKPAKIVFTLKDGEVGNNFNAEQPVELLQIIQNEADDVLFHYCWTKSPRKGRPSEIYELEKLRKAGIYNVIRTNIWEALALASACKCYISEPAGFAEIITVVRRQRPNTTFLFPCSAHQLNIYITRNKDNLPVKYKVNPICFKQAYTCIPQMGKPDENNFRFVSHWIIKYADNEAQIGDNCRGDDWKYFREAHHSIFKDWYEQTKQELINTIVTEMSK